MLKHVTWWGCAWALSSLTSQTITWSLEVAHADVHGYNTWFYLWLQYWKPTSINIFRLWNNAGPCTTISHGPNTPSISKRIHMIYRLNLLTMEENTQENSETSVDIQETPNQPPLVVCRMTCIHLFFSSSFPSISPTLIIPDFQVPGPTSLSQTIHHCYSRTSNPTRLQWTAESTKQLRHWA